MAKANEEAQRSIWKNTYDVYYPTKWMGDKDLTYGAKTIGSGYPPAMHELKSNIRFINPTEEMSSLIAATIASGCNVEVVKTSIPHKTELKGGSPLKRPPLFTDYFGLSGATPTAPKTEVEGGSATVAEGSSAASTSGTNAAEVKELALKLLRHDLNPSTEDPSATCN